MQAKIGTNMDFPYPYADQFRSSRVLVQDHSPEGGRMVARMKILAGALAAALTLGAPLAEAATPRLLVYYVEASPAKAAAVAKALQGYAAKAREKDGADAPQIEVLRELGRPGRMAVIEQWRDLDPAKADQNTKALQAQVGADLQAPIDDRLNDPLSPLDFTTAPTGVFHVLMHIDVVPDGAQTASKALQAQKVSVMAAPGALAFEAATQVGRPNHFAVHEVWKTRADYEAYAASAPGQDLRRQFTQYKGAPFDDRFYGP
jgi:quinol monooxygenase YgiN